MIAKRAKLRAPSNIIKFRLLNFAAVPIKAEHAIGARFCETSNRRTLIIALCVIKPLLM